MELNNLNSSGVQRSECQNNRIWIHSFRPILKIKIKVTSVSLEVHPPLSMAAESLVVVDHCGTIGYPWTVHSPLFSHIALRLVNAPVESRKNWTPARNNRLDCVGVGSPPPYASLSLFCVRWKRESEQSKLSLQTIIFSKHVEQLHLCKWKMKDHIFELLRKIWMYGWSSQLYTQLEQLSN